MPRGTPLDLTGQRFGRWTVLSKWGAAGSKQVRWLCLCECGGQALVQANNLKSGRSTQCWDCSVGNGHGKKENRS